MQWSCPHCGIHLALSMDKVGSGWSFSRCYKCGGFALIRKAEVNVIKVDKAPPGERVLLPEATETPAAGLTSEDASQKLAKHVAPKPSALPPEFKSRVELLPDALPEIPKKGRKQNIIPVGITLAAALTLVSGYYLFGQAQIVWKKARQYASNEATASHTIITDEMQQSSMAPIRPALGVATPEVDPLRHEPEPESLH